MEDYEVVKTDAGYVVHVSGKYYKVPEAATRMNKGDLKTIFEGVKGQEVAGVLERADVPATFVHAGEEPTIKTQPGTQSVTVGGTGTFTVVAEGTAPLTYQWSRGGQAIAGATSASYTTGAALQSDNDSTYTVTISNGVGKVTSTAGKLSVGPKSTPQDAPQRQAGTTTYTPPGDKYGR